MATTTIRQLASSADNQLMSGVKREREAVISTAYHTMYMGSGEASVAPFITLIILVTGVLGGLLIVICVIVYCKYCVTTKKHFRRQVRYGGKRWISERHFLPLQRYETVHSDFFSEPSSTSWDAVTLSPRRLHLRSEEHVSESDDVDETTQLKVDFDKAQQPGVHRRQEVQVLPDFPDGPAPSPARRVSFQLDNIPQPPTPAVDTKMRRCRRYTEGDFHHLKHSKIQRVVQRQYSLGARNWLGESASIGSIERMGRRGRKASQGSANSDTSPTHREKQRKVSVEVHQQTTNFAERWVIHDYTKTYKEQRSKPHNNLRTIYFQTVSHSLEAVSPTTPNMHHEKRKVKSFEDVADYDVLKITEFSKGPFYNTDYDVISELGSPVTSKVRYNDTGSLEELNEEHVVYLNDLDLDGVMPEENDDTETLNGSQKYRELWKLRATLEDEDECSDTIRMEDMSSAEASPDHDQSTSYINSFESSTEALGDPRECIKNREGTDSKNLLHPNYENRRQKYQNVLTKRFKKTGTNTSTENSFDSVETDGDVSDTSRYEVTTTSFESTTDNTDSTTESQQSKLKQMQADSGYKSLETQNSTKDAGEFEVRGCTGGVSPDTLPQIPPAVINSSPPLSLASLQGKSQSLDVHVETFKHSPQRRSADTSTHFDRRNSKTASKKRRAYSRERQMVRVYESINEPETDSKSELASGDSFEDNSVPSKISVFKRFFKSHSFESRERYLVRDYSIDETTNRIFNDFIRPDPNTRCICIRRSPRFHPRQRLHRKQGEGAREEGGRVERLTPELRSTSLGSDSSASSVKRLSPQDSTEEVEQGEQARLPLNKTHSLPVEENIYNTTRNIPIIKLPEDDTNET